MSIVFNLYTMIKLVLPGAPGRDGEDLFRQTIITKT